MKIVSVQYTTTLDFAVTNQANIQAIVDELKTINHTGTKYSTYLMPNGKTFMHLDQFENEEAHEFLQSLQSFKNFAAALEESGLEAEPILELPTMVASTENFWH